MVELLLRYEKKIEFNEEVRTAIDQSFQGGDISIQRHCSTNLKERTRERSIGKIKYYGQQFSLI